ncbi:hypothetical protein STEG23_011807 [Scotinomys teguina]
MVGGRAGPEVMRLGELVLHLTACNTQENKPSILPRQHSKTDLLGRCTGERILELLASEEHILAASFSYLMLPPAISNQLSHRTGLQYILPCIPPPAHTRMVCRLSLFMPIVNLSPSVRSLALNILGELPSNQRRYYNSQNLDSINYYLAVQLRLHITLKQLKSESYSPPFPLSLPFYTSQNHLPRSGITHSWLGFPTSIFYQENAPTDLTTDKASEKVTCSCFERSFSSLEIFAEVEDSSFGNHLEGDDPKRDVDHDSDFFFHHSKVPLLHSYSHIVFFYLALRQHQQHLGDPQIQ